MVKAFLLNGTIKDDINQVHKLIALAHLFVSLSVSRALIIACTQRSALPIYVQTRDE